MYMDLTQSALGDMKNEGVAVVLPSEEDVARIDTLLAPMWDDFVETHGGEGSTAANLVADLRAAKDRYSSMSDVEILALPPVNHMR